jgi:1-acyl-sn-glycerol-3-phosphate acyltransferase
MNRILKLLFFLLIVKVLVLLLIGLRIRHKERLPRAGPAILVANHNSHLDTLVLMSLFPLSVLHHLRPLADEQYFLEQNRCLAWFSRRMIDIIPVRREPKPGGAHSNFCHNLNFLHACGDALDQNDILILYPEGSRGEPECLAEFKSGIAHLAKHHPTVPIIPIFLHGLGKVLPKGEVLLVPFVCDVLIGQPLFWIGNKKEFLQQLTDCIQSLSTTENFPVWN